MSEPSQSANVGTLRTGWNTSIVLVVAGVLSRYTKVELDVEDPMTVAVLSGAVVVFYRLSRVVADRWTWIGYVLFGSQRAPAYPAVPPAPAPLPPPQGEA